MQIQIFDLDGTVIDSSHRKLVNPDNTLNLEHWIENSRPEKVACDSLMMCADTWREAYDKGRTVLICTARVFNSADYKFLQDNDLYYHELLCRPEGCNMADSELKEIQLRLYAWRNGLTWARFCKQAVLYDDCNSVLTRLSGIGLPVINANLWNTLLRERVTA